MSIAIVQPNVVLTKKKVSWHDLRSGVEERHPPVECRRRHRLHPAHVGSFNWRTAEVVGGIDDKDDGANDQNQMDGDPFSTFLQTTRKNKSRDPEPGEYRQQNDHRKLYGQ